MPMSNTSDVSPTAAVRLIFEYEGDTVRLISQQPVQMTVTTPDTGGVDHPGYYVDVRNKEGRALARVPAHAAFASSAEVFPERSGEPITRVDVAKPKGAFTVVVPAAEQASHVTVMRIAPGAAQPSTTPGAAGTRSAPVTTDIATFPLDAGNQPSDRGGAR